MKPLLRPESVGTKVSKAEFALVVERARTAGSGAAGPTTRATTRATEPEPETEPQQV